MSVSFLNISLAIESDLPLDELQQKIKADLEYCYEAEKGTVFSITWDREQALAYTRACAATSITPVKEPPCEHSLDVIEIMKRYNLTLPKAKRGEPPFRGCSVIGEVNGLPTLRGKVVLTNGIKAFLIVGVNDTHHWADIHWDSFIPDDLNSIPADIEIPQPKERKERNVVSKHMEEFVA
jgi:GAF domain-containing protein